VTVRDVLVQIGFLMVTSGAMLAAWAILTGQFSRSEPEAIPAEPVDEELEFVIAPIRRRDAPPRARRETPKAAKPAKPRPAAKSRSPGTKPRPRKPPSSS
jgi:hypothetical protein